MRVATVGRTRVTSIERSGATADATSAFGTHAVQGAGKCRLPSCAALMFIAGFSCFVLHRIYNNPLHSNPLVVQPHEAGREQVFTGTGIAAGFALWHAAALAAGPAEPCAAAAVARLMEKDLVGDPGKEVLMLTVEYLPGGASLPHRHDAQVFVYVLQGELRMQVAGSPAVTLRPRPDLL